MSREVEAAVLTTEEAAALLRVSTKTLLRQARGGRVPGQKIGRSWRFSRDQLLACLAAAPEVRG